MFANLRGFLATAFARLESIPHDNSSLNSTSWFEEQLV